jgi:hypothetical protein
MHAKFHKEWFRHSEVDKGETHIQRQTAKLILSANFNSFNINMTIAYQHSLALINEDCPRKSDYKFTG